jgi:hypothetical protein
VLEVKKRRRLANGTLAIMGTAGSAALTCDTRKTSVKGACSPLFSLIPDGLRSRLLPGQADLSSAATRRCLGATGVEGERAAGRDATRVRGGRA